MKRGRDREDDLAPEEELEIEAGAAEPPEEPEYRRRRQPVRVRKAAFDWRRRLRRGWKPLLGGGTGLMKPFGDALLGGRAFQGAHHIGQPSGHFVDFLRVCEG